MNPPQNSSTPRITEHRTEIPTGGSSQPERPAPGTLHPSAETERTPDDPPASAQTTFLHFPTQEITPSVRQFFKRAPVQPCSPHRLHLLKDDNRRAKAHWEQLETDWYIVIHKEGRKGWRMLPSIEHMNAHRALRKSAQGVY